MGDKSKIEWTDATWNPVTGCSHVSEGCRRCYAEALSHRYGWTSKPWTALNATENVKLHLDRLELPLRWKKPRKVFVNSMSDLFHDQVPFEFIDKVFAAMIRAHWHTYQVLTKRPARMLEYMRECQPLRDAVAMCPYYRWTSAAQATFGDEIACDVANLLSGAAVPHIDFPPRHIWMGVSVEDQRTADERIPLLLQTPAAVRWISAEPLLGPVDLHQHLPRRMSISEIPGAALNDGATEMKTRGLDWVVAGGESGPQARPMHPEWVRGLRDQCQAAGAAFNFKQWGEWLPNAQEYGCHQPAANYNRTHKMTGFVAMCRVGKKAAGQLLDGRTWDEYPAQAVSP